jgi:chromosome partitioning protein
MALYGIGKNRGGVGKSYLTFRIASEYARSHPYKKILVIDLCPQSTASGMFLGGIEFGDRALDNLNNKHHGRLFPVTLRIAALDRRP